MIFYLWLFVYVGYLYYNYETMTDNAKYVVYVLKNTMIQRESPERLPVVNLVLYRKEDQMS